MPVLGRDRRLCYVRQMPIEIAMVMAVEISVGLPLDGEQSLEVNLNDEREQHEGRCEQKGLAVPSQLETAQCTFVIVPAVPKHPIRHRHGTAFTHTGFHPRAYVVGNTLRSAGQDSTIIATDHTLTPGGVIAVS